MDDPLRMSVADCLAHHLEITQESRQVMSRLGAFGQQFGQSASLDEFHREVGTAVQQFADVVDRRDAGVLQLAGHPCLAQEAA